MTVKTLNPWTRTLCMCTRPVDFRATWASKVVCYKGVFTLGAREVPQGYHGKIGTVADTLSGEQQCLAAPSWPLEPGGEQLPANAGDT